MKGKIFIFLITSLFVAQLTVLGATNVCKNSCVGIEDPNYQGFPAQIPGSPQSLINPFGCYGGIDCPNGTNSTINLDTELLNLKKSVSNAKVSSANSAIQINQSDFENIVQVGKSILFSQGFYDNITMDIGIADAVNPQEWTLPTNLYQYVDALTTRLDILSPSVVSPSLQIEGATHVLKRIEAEPNGDEVDNYMHLQIDGTEITDLGTSYDFDEGSDDNFDEEADVELYDVPLDLGDSQTTDDFPIDETTNDNYVKINTVSIVDAFGMIYTPFGNFECLRQTEITKYFRRANGSASFGAVPNFVFRRIKWITKNGFIFSAAVQSENSSHVGLLGFMELTRFVPTNTLTSQSAVKINNDSFGISINNTDFYPHESAILDISSDSLGVLIPRIASTNRPSSPAEGLLVYQVDNTPGFYYFDGTAWQRLNSTIPIASIPSQNARIGVSNTSSIQGKSQLQNGRAFIKFDNPIDNFEDLIINIQLEGDCNGVYISKKNREGFEVKELQKGKSSVKFKWSLNQE